MGRIWQRRHTGPTGTEIDRAFYAYDPVGNPMARQTAGAASTYAYDALDRLLSESSTLSGLVTWGYDRSGRRSVQVSPAGTSTYAYDAADQLLSVTTGSQAVAYIYDANGNRTLKVAPGGTTTFTWDVRDRLAGSAAPGGAVFGYAYDADGHLVQKQYLGSVTHSYNQFYSRGTDLVKAHTPVPGGQVKERYFHLDALGSVQATTDRTGMKETSYGTDAWGNVLSGGLADNPFDYLGSLGYWHDTDAGLEYVRARWLDGGTGNWLSADPVTGEPRYSYVRNKPLRMVDPTGQSPLDWPLVRRAQRSFRSGERAVISEGRSHLRTGRRVIGGIASYGPEVQHIVADMMKFEDDPLSVVQSLIAKGEKPWRMAAERLARKARVLGVDKIGTMIPVSVGGTSISQAQWNAQNMLVPEAIRPLFPPFPISSAFILWDAGFVWGVMDGLLDMIPHITLDPVGHTLRSTQEKMQAAFQIYNLLKREGFHQLIADVLHHARNGFFNFFDHLATADKYTCGRTAGVLAVNLITQVLLAISIVGELGNVLRLLRSAEAMAELLNTLRTEGVVAAALRLRKRLHEPARTSRSANVAEPFKALKSGEDKTLEKEEKRINGKTAQQIQRSVNTKYLQDTFGARYIRLQSPPLTLRKLPSMKKQ